MGGAVSTGIDNDDLTDNLRDGDYIRTPTIERVFRAVDRGEYILPEYRQNAYKDTAWKSNHLHLSAPCIYSEVMEGLCLSPGLSFLNLGSGTGYLSTMAGLIIGSYGINHGVEYYEDVISYANKKLEDFKRYSGAIDEFDFCEPKFMQGNCLCLTNERQYDRVYVGAGCPKPYDTQLKNLLRVGGILVMPFNDNLLQVKRTSQCTWDERSLLSVSFATLIIPRDGCKDTLDLIDIEPQTLQSLCRSKIRNILRRNIDIEMPNLKYRKQSLSKGTQTKRCNKVVIPFPGEQGQGNDEHDVREYLGLVLDQWSYDPRPVTRCWKTVTEADTDSSSDDEVRMETTGSVTVEPTLPDKMNNVPGASKEASTTTEEDAGHSSRGRQKFDSGLGDDSQCEELPGSEEDYDSFLKRNIGCKLRRIDKTGSTSSSDNEDSHETSLPEQPRDMNERKTVNSPYTAHMCTKIKELPLPPILKDYLNFYRAYK